MTLSQNHHFLPLAVPGRTLPIPMMAHRVHARFACTSLLIIAITMTLVGIMKFSSIPR